MEDDNNVFRPFQTVKGGKGEENSLPINDYVIVDIDNNEFYGTGFLIFTPYHLAIMRDRGGGAVPVICVPINRVKVAELDEEIHDEVNNPKYL
jgi:hypothetical protein